MQFFTSLKTAHLEGKGEGGGSLRRVGKIEATSNILVVEATPEHDFLQATCRSVGFDERSIARIDGVDSPSDIQGNILLIGLEWRIIELKSPAGIRRFEGKTSLLLICQ